MNSNIGLLNVISVILAGLYTNLTLLLHLTHFKNYFQTSLLLGICLLALNQLVGNMMIYKKIKEV